MDELRSEIGNQEGTFYQPKALFFKMLSWLWIFPSLTSLFIILRNLPAATTPSAFIQQIRLEQWFSLAVLLVHPAVILLARHYQRTEPFRKPELEPKPGDECKKPY